MSSNQLNKRSLKKRSDNEYLEAHQISGYSGPIPHPDILIGLKNVDETFPERIMKMAENHAKTEDELNRKIVRSNTLSLILGQIFSFLFGCLGIVACVYTATKGNVTGSVMSALAVIVQFTMSAIKRK